MALNEPSDVSSGDIIFATLWNTLKSLLFDAFGSQTYTEENYVTDDESATASLDALDIQAKKADIGNADYLKGFLSRSKFIWKDADEIYIDPGVYDHRGTSNQMVQWNSQLTFVAGSGGSNPDSTDLGASEAHYIYIDDSAVVTLGSSILTASEFINSTTAPTWSDSKHGFYNGSDRCIFAFVTRSGNVINEFFQLSDSVVLPQGLSIFAGVDPDTTWTTGTVTNAPNFGDNSTAIIQFQVLVTTGGTTNEFSWRKFGGGSGLATVLLRTNNSTTNFDYLQYHPITLDASSRFEYRFNASTDTTVSARLAGYKFPDGM